MTISDKIRHSLIDIRDPAYADFQSSLIPSLDPDSVIGVRIPEIRKLAKSLKSDEDGEFIRTLPHRYYDENILHAVIVSKIKDFSCALSETERFLPYVDNWAVCDTLTPKAFIKNADKLLSNIYRWLGSDKIYTVRFGIGMMMRHFLDERFDRKYLYDIAAIRSDEYYVRMMQAWYMAEALAKQYESAVKIIEQRLMEIWTHNKSIQKARESFKIPLEHKEYLNRLKIRQV